MMKRRALHTIKQALLRNSITHRQRRKVIMRFVDKIGLVYFGNVDAHVDEHSVVRGLTVSSSHQDSHYAVGSFDGYDVSIVDRVDTVEVSPGQLKTHNWLIVAIDLQNSKDVPHMFIGAHHHEDSSYSKLFTAFNTLQPVALGTFENYSGEFTKRYNVYAAPSHFIEAEQYFTSEITRMMAAHFWPLSIEVVDSVLYVYSDSSIVTTHLLEIMVKNGLWLAKQLDLRVPLNDSEKK